MPGQKAGQHAQRTGRTKGRWTDLNFLYGDTAIHDHVLSGDGLAQDQGFDLFGDVLGRGQRLEGRLLGRALDLGLGELAAPVMTKVRSEFIARSSCTHHSVIINPGLTVLQRILRPQIKARPLVRWISAALVTA